MSKKERYKSIIGLASVLLAAVAFFALVYQYDNKYTLRAPIAQDGIIYLTKDSLDTPTYLADGWELWADKLVDPEAVDSTEAMRVYIGEYLNLAPLTPDRSPYGVATWRLVIRTDGTTDDCLLLLPEVFSAWKLYLNGSEVASEGSFEPYLPFVRDTVVKLPLDGETELLLQTANYTHYYSGITYPPVIGSPQAILRYVGLRLLCYGVLCCAALTAALFSAAFWLGSLRSKRRDPVAVLFGTLALGFAVWVSYPLSRFLGVGLVRLFYALEDAAFLLIMWCALRIALHLCGLCSSRLGRNLSSLALAMLLVGIAVPLLVLPTAPAFAIVHGKLITFYRLLSSLVLVALAVYGTLHGHGGSGWMLGGAGLLAAGLLAGALTVQSFEPAQLLWFEEYGAAALVVCFGVLMVGRHYALVAENQTLTEHLREEVERKTHDMALLVSERDDLISKFLHDMRSPAAFMLSYAQMVREHNVSLDDDTKEQLAVLEEKCGDLNERVHQAQLYTIQNPLLTPHKPVELRAFLREFYHFCQPDVEMDGQNFTLSLPNDDCWITADTDKLERLLQNLIYNAVSYTPTDGEIALSLTRDDASAYLSVRDSGEGIAPEVLPKIFDRFYTTRAQEGGTGLGLYIVRTIVREHGGDISVESKLGNGTVFTIRLPLNSH